MFGIFQSELPDIERGKTLFIDEGAHTVCRNRRPLRFAHGPGDGARRGTTRGTYSPQRSGSAAIGRKNDLAAVGCPCWRSHDRTIIECETFRRASLYWHNKYVIADSRHG